MKRRGSAAAGRAKKRQTRSSRAESVEVKPEPQEKEQQEEEPKEEPTPQEPAEPAGAGQAAGGDDDEQEGEGAAEPAGQAGEGRGPGAPQQALADGRAAATIKQEPGASEAAGPEGGEKAAFGTPQPSPPPKALAELEGGGTLPLAAGAMGLGGSFGRWSTRSARLAAVYLRHHYKQARAAEWDAMGAANAGPDNVRRALLDGGDAAAPTKSLTVVEMDTDTLNDHLSCPICLGVIRKTVTTIECLHRFCAECIEKSLRLGQKECPTCRERCPSRRFLRPDPNFDALIAAVYPDLDGWEKTESKRIDELNKVNSANHQELMKNLEAMQDEQKLVRRQRAGRGDYTLSGAGWGIEEARGGGAYANDTKVSICLTRNPGCTLGKLGVSELNLQPESTIGNLCEYVRSKLKSKHRVDVIYRTACGEDVVLGESLVLSTILGGGPGIQSTIRLSYKAAA